MTATLDVVLLGYNIPDPVLTDLVCRFTSNIPHEERKELVRVCFQIELAHWFFVDHYCKPGTDLQHLSHIPFNVFALQMFRHTPYLKQFQSSVDTAITEFRSYKTKVPTCGAILMTQDMSEVLLVQGFRNQWGFPKGKINKDEDNVVCAIREVMEETGYDMSKLVNPNHFIESTANDRTATLYLVVGVDRNFPFRPQTAFEIKEISWFGIHELPENKKDTQVQCRAGYSNSHFFTVYSYVRRLKRWIQDKLDGTNSLTNFRCFQNRGDGLDTQTREQLRNTQPNQQTRQSQAGAGPGNSDQVAKYQLDSSLPAIAVGGRLTQPITPQKPRNPKRRLNFDDPNTAIIGKELSVKQNKPKTIVTPVRARESTDTDNSPPRPAPLPLKMKIEPVKHNPNFFQGQGADAWLNFTLDLKEVLHSLNLT